VRVSVLQRQESVILSARMTARHSSSKVMERISLQAIGLVLMPLYKWLSKRLTSDCMVSHQKLHMDAARYRSRTGRVECVYEPAMTKAFLHGRTEAIRSVQPESVNFTKVKFKPHLGTDRVIISFALDILLGMHSRRESQCAPKSLRTPCPTYERVCSGVWARQASLCTLLLPTARSRMRSGLFT